MLLDFVYRDYPLCEIESGLNHMTRYVNNAKLDRDGKVKIVFNNEIVRVFQTESE